MSHVFVSHASADDAFVAQLRQRLEALGITVWVDSRNMRGGAKLAPEVEQAISEASHVLVVLGPATVNSPWVRREIDKALEAESFRRADGYRVVPLLLPGISPGALENWFPEEPLAVPVQVGPGGLSEALPEILASLGRRLPTDHEPFEEPDDKPVEELVLTLTDPRIETGEGKRRAHATAVLSYEPAQTGARSVVSRRFPLTSPLGPIEAAELAWYLESYHLWPVGVFAERAEAVERELPSWGRELYEAAMGDEEAREALTAWQQAVEGAERRFSVMVDSDLAKGASAEAEAAAAEGAVELLSLPWELLHDGRGWLFQGRNAVRVRRRLPNRRRLPDHPTALPVRILLVSPRPERDDRGNPIGYIDHRISARPLVEAVEQLGDLARLTVLQPPTYAALEQALRDGDDGVPFDVVHFDGHGVYDRRRGLGGLCFEDPRDVNREEDRRLDWVDARRLAGLVREHRIPLVFLEACQTAVAEVDPTASVAARLLDEGVASVVAMSYSVLVETARRFVEAFYRELAGGTRVGTAMLAGQEALFGDATRGTVLGAGELRLQDWFVPVLFQEEQDPHLVTKIPTRRVQQLQAVGRRLSLGDLPEAPSHHFQGRSRELLALERLLHREPWAVVRGTGGQGKTTLAVELARWLVQTARFSHAAFVSLEHHRDDRAVLDTLGHQLVGTDYTVAQYKDLDAALQPLERALADHPTIVVLDNCESLLADLANGDGDADADDAATAVFAVCRRLLAADSRTRLVFTTREALSAPFDHPRRHRELGALDREDAIQLVSQVLEQNGWTPPRDDQGNTPQEVTELVEAVDRHARALVLLAREVARRGVRATTADLRSLMADLERKHPGDREKSLYASVELTLRRLSPASRDHVRQLAACHGGVHLDTLRTLTGLEPDDVRALAEELVGVGLAEDAGYGHLRLDPGLTPYLLGELTPDEAASLHDASARAMESLAVFLRQRQFDDPQVASQLTLLELPNLLAMLDHLPQTSPPEDVVDVATRVEDLLQWLGRPRAMAHATGARERAAQALGDWSHALFLAETAHLERLFDSGNVSAAREGARLVLGRALAAGETAYPAAAYDIALAHVLLGRYLKESGAAEEALSMLTEGLRRFQEFTDANGDSADRMTGVTLTEIGDCLRDLGRLDEAADAYDEATQLNTRNKDPRSAAVARGQLATVRLLQGRYEESLRGYVEARNTFEQLSEPGMVGVTWHQIGMLHRHARQIEAAEQAYRKALAIWVREKDLRGQLDSLIELGTLYVASGRLEEAVTFYRQAIEVAVRSENAAREGMVRHNLGRTLLTLSRYDEARRELERAITCIEPYGHAAEPWKTWSSLALLEQATGHLDAAESVWREAVERYLSYRRAGGASQSDVPELFAAVVRAFQDHTEAELARELSELSWRDIPAELTALVVQLQAILAGVGELPASFNAEIDYRNFAELVLLLETLPERPPDWRHHHPHGE